MLAWTSSDRKSLTTFGPASLERGSTILGQHALAETVDPGPRLLLWLIGSLRHKSIESIEN